VAGFICELKSAGKRSNSGKSAYFEPFRLFSDFLKALPYQHFKA
jgi:hypothetical protein